MLLAVITSATQDEKPRMSLSEVSQLINECNGASVLVRPCTCGVVYLSQV